MKQYIETFSHDFLEKIWVSFKNIEVTELTFNQYTLSFQSEDSGLLIGSRWATMSDLGRILSLCISRHFNTRVIVRCDINNYIKEKEIKFLDFIDAKAKYVVSSQTNAQLTKLTSSERKIAHNYIAQNFEKLHTHSSWTAEQRVFHIEIVKQKLELDIQSSDI